MASLEPTNIFYSSFEALRMYIVPAIAATFALLSPIHYVLLCVFIFIFADTVFGIWASFKKGKSITSRRLVDMPIKMGVYALIVIITYGLDYFLLGEFVKFFVEMPLAVTKVSALVLIATEGYSIDEKLRSVHGKGVRHHISKLLKLAKEVRKEVNEIKD